MIQFYVVGNKSSKSLSPLIFNYWFKKYNIKAQYGFLELNKKNFDKKIKQYLNDKNVGGLNITIPFKQKIIKHIDKLDSHSLTINAVNCVTLKSKKIGTNTDWRGYYKTLPKTKKLKQKNVVLIGYGGAALAIHYVLKVKGFKNIKILNRTKKKLMFQNKKEHTISMSFIQNYIADADLIINTTPRNPISKKNKNLIRKETILSDIVYKPKETPFLKNFPNHKKIYGISMLIEQAIPCFNHWFGFVPAVDNKLKNILEKKIK